MRKLALLGVAAATVLGLGGVVAASTGSQPAGAATKRRLTLRLLRLATR